MNKVTEDTQLCNVGGACAQDATPSQELLPGAAAENTVYRIPAMDCATEEMEIRQALSSVVGVRRLGFALGTRTLMITAGAAGQQQAQDAIRAAGFEINLVDAGQSGRRCKPSPLTTIGDSELGSRG